MVKLWDAVKDVGERAMVMHFLIKLSYLSRCDSNYCTMLNHFRTLPE